MSLNNRLEDLDPLFRGQAQCLLQRLKEAGIPVRVNETRRRPEVQRAFYAQGREELAKVNALRKAAGLWPLSPAENTYCVIWDMDSKHVRGLALDVVPLDLSGHSWWGAPDELWQRMGEIGEGCGLRWGGRWKEHADRTHFEAPEED